MLISASGLPRSLSQRFQLKGMASKVHYFCLFMSLPCSNLTYLFIKYTEFLMKPLKSGVRLLHFYVKEFILVTKALHCQIININNQIPAHELPVNLEQIYLEYCGYLYQML